VLLPVLPREGAPEEELPTAPLPLFPDASSAETAGDEVTRPQSGEPRKTHDVRDRLRESKSRFGDGERRDIERRHEPSEHEASEAALPGHLGMSVTDSQESEQREEKRRVDGTARETDIRRAPATSERKALYVDDAGIVLLHPFLAAHFEKLGLQRDGAFLDEDARERAVHQLRFLATGEDEAPEPLLVFEKILCGLAPDVPVARWIPLDERAKSEADALLRAVIRHWDALKNTSPDGLRETFLRREGRLERKDDGWKLQIESRSYDILLDRLPWNRSIVRLPWMAGLLGVEWA
jgi:hypothetical protein